MLKEKEKCMENIESTLTCGECRESFTWTYNIKSLLNLDDLSDPFEVITLTCKDEMHRFQVENYFNSLLNGHPAYLDNRIVMTDDDALNDANPNSSPEELGIPSGPCVVLYLCGELSDDEIKTLPELIRVAYGY